MAPKEQGAAAVEFALVSAILFLLIFGIIEFGLYFSRREVYESAAREGARVAAVRGSEGDVKSRIIAAAEPYDIEGIDSLSVSTPCTFANSGQPVTVSWQEPFNISMPFVPGIDVNARISAVFKCE
jgi:Flp pilus assembly protein TadG